MTQLDLKLIQDAKSALEGKIRTTPLEYSQKLSELLKVPTYLKLENLQITGSFKIRGAYFRLLHLKEQEKKTGIITCSAGNHGKGIAYVAKQLGIPATIYVPKNVDQSKYDGMRSYGAEVVRSSYYGFEETDQMARSEAKGRPYISAFEDPCIMAGNGGTLAMEIHEQLPDLKTLIIPVGGGGLAAGACFYAKSQNMQVIGVQHKDSPALHLSLAAGKPFTKLPSVDIIAGGLEGGIGAECFHIIQPRIEGCLLVSDEETIDAFRWCLSHLQYLVEPSAAVVIAAALSGKIKPKEGPIVIALTGRNVSLETTKNLLGSYIRPLA